MYEVFVKRTTVEELNRERAAQIRSTLSNSALYESTEGQDLQKKMVQGINERFDEAIMTVRDPGRHNRQMRALRADPLMAAGIRGLEKLKWDIKAGKNPFN